ncbi:diiron oxygenase [Adhaeribacter rhizoryzae]|uniref:Diiron oxygenase n=1 Tax=Adhaeribacter rhizoryzae TaxID=2607907 RepID=A0A5M6DBT1_9BACT|nr:diiron oxygenase [Adhaeribacter rhizoryzae]KAA5545004.1 diiron oxygenase [Adhaeribacter rhizoryzae]
MEVQEVERLIKISKDKPLLPETFVPWNIPALPEDEFLPEKLNSLSGLPFYDSLTPTQKTELGRHEVVQVMYSYGWSEALFCLFMNRYILTLQPDNVEYKFLLRELIEEFRHQEMFAQAIAHLNGKPIKPTRLHNFLGQFTVKFMPVDAVFMSCLAVEMMADLYGNHLRKGPRVYPVLKKVAELHNIEEGRHIHFTKAFLRRYTDKAGYVKRSFYSYLVLFNVLFMRTMYVKKEIFGRLGLQNPDQVYKMANQNYKRKFGQECLKTIVQFVDEWGGFNRSTRWAWRLILKANV